MSSANLSINGTPSSSNVKQQHHRCAADTAAALSLCALGRSSSPSTALTVDASSTPRSSPFNHGTPLPYTAPTINVASPYYYNMPIRPPPLVTPTSSIGSAPGSIQDLTKEMGRLSPQEHARYDILSFALQQKTSATSTTLPMVMVPKKVAPLAPSAIMQKKKNAMKPRDPKRDTAVPFDEMKRLMNVYGPIKASRNRTNTNKKTTPTTIPIKEAKPESIRRKFYRWFPDFNVRFIKSRTDDYGIHYMPRIGHAEELEYRDLCRRRDTEVIIRKRNNKRYLPPHLFAVQVQQANYY